jgi:hypothetical protein
MNELVRFALVAFYPRVDDVPGLAELDLDERLAALRRDSTLLFWVGLVGAAVFFQLSPILTVRWPLPAARLSAEDLDQHALRIATHRSYLVRQVIVLLKLVAGMLWGQSPEIRARLGLAPYPVDPGTRRTERFVARPVLAPRAPSDALVRIGRREEQLGRGLAGGHDGGRVA